MAGNIDEWLESLGLDRYAEAFAKNEIDLQALPHLTDDDLIEIGVALGARRKILAAVSGSALADVPPTLNWTGEDHPNSAEAERRQLTVMFCDLVGSTEISEQLDPEDLRDVLRAYQASCTDAVAQFEGHVAKYIGDGLLVYFGYPQAHEDDAQRAVSAGLGIVDGVEALNLRLAKTHKVDLSVRVGIHTGLVVAGEMGSGETLEAGAIVGATPNLAARLEGIAEPNTVVISAATQSLVDGLFEWNGLGGLQLKGISDPVNAYRVTGKSDVQSRFEAAIKRGLTPLIGREEEVGLLLKRWEQTKDGDGQLVLLSGEAGVGKSRILRAFRDRIDDEPHSRVLYFGSPYHRNSAFYPAIDQLERAIRVAREDSAEQRLNKLEEALSGLGVAAESTVPALAQLLNLEAAGRYPIPETSPQQLKAMTMEALVSIVEAMARQQPVLIVLEDLHAADPSTLELIEQYIERLRKERVLVLATYRPEFEPPWGAYAHATALVLNRLSRKEVAGLIEKIAGGKMVPAAVVDQIVERTDGVPLFVEELTKTMLESDSLTEADDRYHLSASFTAHAIPSSLQDSLMARLDRLSAVKEVAQLASAIGRNFEHDLLAAVTHLDQKTLTEALDKLIGAELVFRRGTPPNARYEFKHALVQDVAYQSLLNSTRHEHHRRIAMAMESQFPQIAKSQPELLARHYTEAALPEQAIPYWLNAARQAAERFASLEAIVHCERAFDILPKVPESAARDQQELDLLLVFALAHMSAKGFGNPEILHIYNRAQELAENLADDSALFTVTWGQWINHQQRAQVEQARGFVEAVSTIAGRTNDSELILQAHHASWTTNLILGDHAAVSLGVSEGLKIYDSTRHRSHAFRFGGHDPGVCAHLHGALTSWAQGYPDQAAQYIAQGISLAEEISHPLSFVIAFAMASLIGQHRGEASKVLISAQRTIDVCSEIGVPHYTGVGHILHGWATVSSGDIDSGIAEMVQGLEIFSATGAALRLPYFLCLLAEAYCMAGKHDNSIEAIEDAHKAVEQVGEEWWHADVQRVWGDISLAQSPENPGDAESRYLKSLDIARAQGAKSLELRGATSLAHLRAIQGRKKEAREVLAPVFDWFSEGFETADLKKAAHLLEELT